MEFGKLSAITGKCIKDWKEWLEREQEGCCSLCYSYNTSYNYCVCMGWHDLGDGPKEDGYRHWVVAWKIGRQSPRSAMQSDLDIDFEMPYNRETGDVDDTEEPVGNPKNMAEWNALAVRIRDTARRVWKDWKDDYEK